MIEIRVNMNSNVEDVLAHKTCCSLAAQDQNLEIMVFNRGQESVEIPSHIDLETDQGTRRITNLVPAGGTRIDPGEVKAMYCQMDEALWARSSRIVLFDRAGGTYPVDIE